MQYLTEKEILPEISHVNIKPEELGRTDTYNEEMILKKILKYSKDDQKLLAKAAHQIAIIGAGGKSYGFVYGDKNEVMNLEDIFKKLNVKYKNTINTKLDEDDLTPRRLVRFFRYHVQKFIKDTNRPSYLWLKYADRSDSSMMYVCFPGAEHLVKNKNEIDFLKKTYGNLDSAMDTQFVQRLDRVFLARQIIDYKDMSVQKLKGKEAEK
jgi:hypothetical protein